MRLRKRCSSPAQPPAAMMASSRDRELSPHRLADCSRDRRLHGDRHARVDDRPLGDRLHPQHDYVLRARPHARATRRRRDRDRPVDRQSWDGPGGRRRQSRIVQRAIDRVGAAFAGTCRRSRCCADGLRHQHPRRIHPTDSHRRDGARDLVRLDHRHSPSGNFHPWRHYAGRVGQRAVSSAPDGSPATGRKRPERLADGRRGDHRSRRSDRPGSRSRWPGFNIPAHKDSNKIRSRPTSTPATISDTCAPGRDRCAGSRNARGGSRSLSGGRRKPAGGVCLRRARAVQRSQHPPPPTPTASKPRLAG